jgi:hypothetical protein
MDIAMLLALIEDFASDRIGASEFRQRASAFGGEALETVMAMLHGGEDGPEGCAMLPVHAAGMYPPGWPWVKTTSSKPN